VKKWISLISIPILCVPLLFNWQALEVLKLKTFDALVQTPDPSGWFTTLDITEEEDLEFTELDINFLDVNYLEDLLNVLDALAVAEDEDQLAQATSTQITGTSLGKDPDTQITTLITGNVVSLRRSVSESVQLDVNGSESYTVIFIQDGVSNVVKINGGGDSIITITQGG